MLFNCFGHPFQITDYNIDSRMKDYFAWSAASTVAEITRIAATNFQLYIEEEKKPFDILADTHDSYMTQCPLMFVQECRDMKRKLMNQPLVSPNDGTKFNMKSEQNIGFNWNSKKSEGVNPLGLQELPWMN